MTDCPHCMSRVLATASGACPACRKDLRSAPPSEWVPISVSPDNTLPDVCMRCGKKTLHRAWIQDERRVGGEGLLLKFLLLLAKPKLLFSSEVQGQKQQLSIKVPICESCHKENPIEVQFTNFEQGTLTFIVHRDFRQALMRIRRTM